MIHDHMPRFSRRPPCLTFSPLAWLKLQYFCHAGDSEIAGFAITAKDDPLYVAEFVTVRQNTSSVTVVMDDQAVADYLDRCVDAGLPPQRTLRIWIHTHPGSSAQPSHTDEGTFARVFGSCEWAVMFILSRSGDTYARLTFNIGPGAAVPLPVSVDWAAWPAVLSDPVSSMANRYAEWRQEFATNVQPMPELPFALSVLPFVPSLSAASPLEPSAGGWDWGDLDQELWEDFERHERTLNGDIRA